MVIRSNWLALVFALTAGQAALAQATFDDLLKRVPSSANAIMVIDVAAVHSSPLAVQEGWKDTHEAEYVKRPLILPPEAERIVLASQMNANRELKQDWELAIMTLTEDFSMRAIARAEGGYVDSIDGKDAAWTPSDAYFVNLEPKLLGVMHPADRQAVTRWVNLGQESGAVTVSEYLKSAAASVNKQTPIVMALDLNGVVRPHNLDASLKESDLTKDDPAKQKAWFNVLMGLKGVTLRVELTEKARGNLEVNFAGSTELFGKDAKPLVLEALNKFGVGIDELDNWRATLRSNAIILEGDLSKPAMRKLFSLLELPSGKFSSLKGEEAASDSPDVIAKASKSYFDSVTTLLDDIRNEFSTNRDARRSLAPVYLDRYARNIDRLPILNVDEELLAFGGSVGETLRTLSASTKSGNVRAGVRKSQTYGAYTYNYDGYGYYNVRSTSTARNQVDSEEQGRTTIQRFNTWKQVEDSLAAIRKTMTKKYNMEF